ncbi:MAG: Asp-tRNA(Asn)/Glu-tRNA(Gln) amidotransferase subunit GatA [Clostridia bacterium]|nr:Asp-tRNA(Asn)/Glu-tRNA(Gln) amidotransferase subunit GatA [Clostridia bacterium]
MELYQYTAAELSAMLREKRCSAAELAASVFSRIDSAEPQVGAYLTLTREQAERDAAQIDERRAHGEELPPLAGIPVGIKDNICTNGVRTTCASKILENFVPPYDAGVVEKLSAACTVTTGKFNMDEFAMGSSCETSHFQKTHNPRDLACVPGGSSGGSAAAVAAGEAVLALGSDTGGSIRQPASYCGVVGLKPTYGAVSRYGLVAFASSLDQIGPFGRCVTDAAMLFDAIRGHDGRDATSVREEFPPLAPKLDGRVAGLSVGIPDEYFGPGVDDDVKENVLAAARVLESSGARTKRISLPGTKYALSAYYIIACAEASSNLARYDGVKYGFRAPDYDGLLELYERSRSEGFGAEVKRRILLGTFVLSSGYYDAYYKKAKLTQMRIRDEYTQAFKACDIILTPTAPGTAFRLGDRLDDPVKMYAADVCTVPVNIAGLPAVSLPCGKDRSGLPVGLQLIGRKFGEEAILNAALAFENTLPVARPCAVGRKEG